MATMPLHSSGCPSIRLQVRLLDTVQNLSSIPISIEYRPQKASKSAR